MAVPGSRASTSPAGPAGSSRRIHLLGALLALLPSVSAIPATQVTTVVTDPCDRKLVHASADPLAYQPRGERCEGVYVREVAGVGGFSVVAFTTPPHPFTIKRGEPLAVDWVGPGDRPTYVRAVSLRRKLYYRMDAQRPAGSRRFDWPTDVLAALNLRSEELGVVAWVQGRVGDSPQDIYVPLRLGGAAEAGAGGQYVVQVTPGTELQEVFVTLATVDPSGRDGTVLLRDQPLKRGFYPAERAIPIPLPKLTQAGLYRLQLNALLSQGAPSSRNLYFQHTGG